MIKILSKLFAVAPLLLAPILADASIVLELNPVSQTASTVDIALQISGLGDGVAPSLGVFDVDVSFDPAHLAFSGAEFGDPVLGDQLDVLGLGWNPLAASLTSSGTAANLYEVSLDLAEDLNSLQADSFTLAVLTFNILTPGSSNLEIVVNALGDADGGPLTPDQVVGTAVTSVPLPGTLFMMLPGLAGIAAPGFRRRA